MDKEKVGVKRKVETTLYLSDELSRALKMTAVEEKRRYSDVAENLLRQSLGLKELKRDKQKD